MKEIREYTAEVFRRSEKRIKDRKRNRRRMLLLCIPFFLVMTAVSAMILPALIPARSAHDNAAELVLGSESKGNANGTVVNADANDNASEGMTGEDAGSLAYTVVEIRDVGLSLDHSEKVTDQAVVMSLFGTIQALFADIEGAGQSVSESAAENEDVAQDPTETDSAGKWKNNTIIFTAEEGLQTVYRLRGNILSSDSTNEKAVLSDAQVAELLAVFGILE